MKIKAVYYCAASGERREDIFEAIHENGVDISGIFGELCKDAYNHAEYDEILENIFVMEG